MRIFALFVPACFTALMVVACNSDPTIPNDLVSEQPATSGTKPGRKDAGTAVPTPIPPGPSPTPPSDAGGMIPAPGTCGASAKQAACFTCCESANPKALPILDQAWGDCLCVAPGACKAACGASFCAGVTPTVGDACDTCVTANDQTCSQKADTACLASADCKPLFACADAANCSAKPK